MDPLNIKIPKSEHNPQPHPVQTPECSPRLHVPSPIITRRTRTDSISARALLNPQEKGKVAHFSRSKGHGFIQSSRGGDEIFVHISDAQPDVEEEICESMNREYCCGNNKYECCTPSNIVDFILGLIEGEYVPRPGDEVKYRLCPIPPKFEKTQAVHVEIINFTPEVHVRWDAHN